MKASRSLQQSPLNLKFFDVKFLKLDEGKGVARIRSPRNLESYRQASEHSSEMDNTAQLEFELDSLTRAVASQLEDLQKSEKRLAPPDGKENLYRQRISDLRSSTEQLHREIITLYQREHAEATAADNVRKICHVELVNARGGKSLSPAVHDNALSSFYDNLRRDCNSDYLRKIDEAKNRIAGSNVLRKFEEELMSKNKRVPMFLKEMHS